MTAMTSLERVLTTLGHQEPDRVPLFLLVTMHGARELGLSLRDYFAHAEYVAEGQLRMAHKYQNDCLYALFYAALEVEAWGGEVIFSDDGPANAGEPMIRKPEAIRTLKAPVVETSPVLGRVLDAIRQMRSRSEEAMPIIGVVIAPFSLPVMQLGFEQYLTWMYEQPEVVKHLLQINAEFAVAWANAQLEAGATAICYFDPVASTTVVSREQYLDFDHRLSKDVIARIKGPVATHVASGRCMPLLDDFAQTGALAVAVSIEEDLALMKQKVAGRVSLLGNLNGIEMRRWTEAEAEAAVKAAIAAAGRGGGFILADNHGEIPFQVPETTLMVISEAVQRWGRYPLDWVGNER
ncbi:uroporphyrinogen decarboxylase family protein [Candidatus Chloroploca asiatica]|uniref:Uroporphyrinogen decarboxylase n=1 Tax=Candidatus Chloroploca asiatica TaxID=1506545 RepID=A0A2H3KVV5_9CHLR|nr:uroporphyrinogen decarboxylase family protein [Candidatus Chloroploca asiatica]PDV99494.1 uroporphyrinogen decarboxylase [Candidatus Chloroploca asiatica]